MPTLELSHDVQIGVYDPDDVGLRDSPLLKPLRPRLQPTPSPPPEDLDSEDSKPVPSQGDAVLIGLLGGGKALEVARTAGTENLAADDDEVSAIYERTDHTNDLDYFTANALDSFHTSAPNSPNELLLGQANITSKANTLSPAQESPAKPEKTTTPKRPSQQDRSLLFADDTAANQFGNKNPNLISQLQSTQSSLVAPDFQVNSAPSPETQISQSTVPNNSCSTDSRIGGFRCTYAGCTAKPFQTQYLLKSHANVHSSDRRFYCHVKGCTRSEGGKGFKRKNEMIRHGLVHESPGYTCPYCIDQGRRYPRPDNLQRLVYLYKILESIYLILG